MRSRWSVLPVLAAWLWAATRMTIATVGVSSLLLLSTSLSAQDVFLAKASVRLHAGSGCGPTQIVDKTKEGEGQRIALSFDRVDSEQVNATYTLITPLVGVFTDQPDGIDWEAVLASGAGGPGFTWEDAKISYSDQGATITPPEGPSRCISKWSVSDSIVLESETQYLKELMRRLDGKQHRDFKTVRLPGFMIYGASTAGVGKYMMPALSISVEAFHPEAVSTQCWGGKITKADRTVFVTGAVPQEPPVQPMGQPTTKEQLEKQVMDQLQAAIEGKMSLSEVGRQPWMTELPEKVVQGSRSWTKDNVTYSMTWEFSR